MVRPVAERPARSWAKAPLPMLVIEVLSESTRRRDHLQKRDLYIAAGIPEYWIVDEEERTIRVVRPDRADVVSGTSLAWHPANATDPLVIDVRALFRDALD
jgi:Uma2 family endonuclease